MLRWWQTWFLESQAVVEPGGWESMVTKDTRVAHYLVTGRQIITLGNIGTGTVWRAQQVLSLGDAWAPTPETAVQGEDPSDE